MAAEAHAGGGNGGEVGSRPPTEMDIVELCAGLNRAGARYVVVGGLAIIQAGHARFTEDVDLLIETTVENETKVLEALRLLPDSAASQVAPGEVDHYGVVRISDEIMVDLMKSGCGVTYADAIRDADWREIQGVRIPFASKSTLWKMKQTVREKDIPDRLFLRQALEREGVALNPPLKTPDDPLTNMPRWLRRVLAWLFRQR
ncbi:MAG: hypothetical protein K1X78_10550 [Verrucomicrobiaceae bacterium]|nr:hypothetical protein [Verrucomicrobiaceae bacterium]